MPSSPQPSEDPTPSIRSQSSRARVELDESTYQHITPERSAIFEALSSRAWFRASDLSIQHELATLPADHDGFLKDLAARPERIANVSVISMEKLARGNFALIPIFEVRNDEGKTYTYEYVSWKHGPMSGAKGIVFIETEGEISHFVYLRGEKFAPGKEVNDVPGGFSTVDENGTTLGLGENILKELGEELLLPEVRLLREPVNLGLHQVDGGMTNNAPTLFAAFIDGSESERLGTAEFDKDDNLELDFAINIRPISELKAVARENTDGFFRSIILACWANGILDLESI